MLSYIHSTRLIEEAFDQINPIVSLSGVCHNRRAFCKNRQPLVNLVVSAAFGEEVRRK